MKCFALLIHLSPIVGILGELQQCTSEANCPEGEIEADEMEVSLLQHKRDTHQLEANQEYDIELGLNGTDQAWDQGTPGTIIYAKDFVDANALSARQKRLDAGLVEKLYHQTDMHSCHLIFANHGENGDNFRPGSYGLAGPGIYFAVKAFHTQWKAQKFGCMIEAVVKTGNMHQLGFKGQESLTGGEALKNGWDSTWIPRGKNPYLTPEVVIYFNDQIVKMTYYPCDKAGKRRGSFAVPKIEYTRQCAGAAAFPCVLKGGCNAGYEPDEPCQCTHSCKKYNSCCKDFDAVCAALKGKPCPDF